MVGIAPAMRSLARRALIPWPWRSRIHPGNDVSATSASSVHVGRPSS